MSQRITSITRRDIIDALAAEKISWSGRLEEPEFLSRLFDLDNMPSTDSRFDNAAGDIWQHRINNHDWDDEWVFKDPRFRLFDADDEVFLQFLCESVHPVVRPDVTESQKICQLYNQFLLNDGFELAEKTRISGRSVYIGRYVGLISTPGISSAKEALATPDASYVAQQITRMETAVANDPALAIGTAKELIETICKTILDERNRTYSKSADIPELVKATAKALKLTPDDIPDTAKASDTIRRILGNLGSIPQGIAELRNLYGTGHGKTTRTKGLGSRHAKLAVGAAATLAVFLIETHNERSPQ
ncbi:MAG: abortive infection family protein [Terriglobales bacterium]